MSPDHEIAILVGVAALSAVIFGVSFLPAFPSLTKGHHRSILALTALVCVCCIGRSVWVGLVTRPASKAEGGLPVAVQKAAPPITPRRGSAEAAPPESDDAGRHHILKEPTTSARYHSKAPQAAPTPDSGDRYTINGNVSGGHVGPETNIYGPQPRELTPERGAALMRIMPLEKPVKIVAVLGDPESRRLSEQISRFLKVNGYNIVDESDAYFAEPRHGVEVHNGGPTVLVVVGDNLSPS